MTDDAPDIAALVRWVNQANRYKALVALQEGPLRRGDYTRRKLGTIYWNLADRLLLKGLAAWASTAPEEECVVITDLGRRVLAERGA